MILKVLLFLICRWSMLLKLPQRSFIEIWRITKAINHDGNANANYIFKNTYCSRCGCELHQADLLCMLGRLEAGWIPTSSATWTEGPAASLNMLFWRRKCAAVGLPCCSLSWSHLFKASLAGVVEETYILGCYCTLAPLWVLPDLGFMIQMIRQCSSMCHK